MVGNRTVSQWIRQLQIRDKLGQVEAEDALVSLAPHSIEPLIRASHDHDEGVRQEVAITFCRFRAGRTGQDERMISGEDVVRDRPSVMLYQVGPSGAVRISATLGRMLDDSSSSVRHWALSAIAYLGFAESVVVQRLLQLVADGDAAISVTSAMALGAVGTGTKSEIRAVRAARARHFFTGYRSRFSDAIRALKSKQ
jgi:HEAT repeat protein